MINFKDEAISIKEELINMRRYLHMHPELGFSEENTSKYIKEILTKEGIEFKEFAKTGICGMIKGEKNDTSDIKVVALRADIDALPIEEKNVCAYKSTIKWKMHACGHDGHTAILLGASIILNKFKKHFNGIVKVIFEPAEETSGGAKIMIEEGVLSNPKVDIICGLHVEETLECGKIKVRKGAVNAASNPFSITIKGAGGHGAYPEEAIDPIVIAAHVITSVQSIVTRETTALTPSVITIANIHGGTAQNIIPEEVKLTGIIRTMDKDNREFLKKRLKEMVKGICTSFRGECDIEIEESYPSLHNDEYAVDLLKKSAFKVIGENNVTNQEKSKMGVESFAYFAEVIPAVFYFLGCRNESLGIIHPAHNSLFDIDEECLPLGVAIQCQFVLDYLTS